MKKLLLIIAIVLSAAASWGQTNEPETVKADTELVAVISPTASSPQSVFKPSIQQYAWERWRHTSCFLMQRGFWIEGGSRLGEFGAGCKVGIPGVDSVTLAYSTDRQLVSTIVWKVNVGGKDAIIITDHKLAINSTHPGFLFYKGFYPITKAWVIRVEGIVKDSGTLPSFQPGVEWRRGSLAYTAQIDPFHKVLAFRLNWRPKKQ